MTGESVENGVQPGDRVRVKDTGEPEIWELVGMTGGVLARGSAAKGPELVLVRLDSLKRVHYFELRQVERI
mgnify:CR=1 FL=1